MRPLILIICVLCTLGMSARSHPVTEAELQQALGALDASLRHSTRAQNMRQAFIDSLAAEARRTEADSLRLHIADVYLSFNTDSALYWLAEGTQSPDSLRSMPYRWRHAALLPLIGVVDDAVREYNSIDPAAVAAADRAQYLEAGRQMYSYIAAFYSGWPELSRRYTDSVCAFQQRLLRELDPNSSDYKFTKAENYFMTGRRSMAKIILEDLLEQLSDRDKLKARTAHHLSSIAKEEGDSIAYLYYLALSARSDVELATREMLSLQELGSQLGNRDIERAYAYTNKALQNAVECRATIRAVDTSQALPVIEMAHQESVSRWRRMVYAVMTGLAVLLVGLVLTLLLLRYEIVKMKRLQLNLKQANRAKEIYISQFLQLCSVYMNKLTQFSKLVTRKLAAGQSDELYRMAKSGKFIDEQSREFYEIFDDAFLHIYPNFVQDVNALLRPGGKIELKEGEKLNTDLRILAFMRLGIEESARIAQVLNYSLNTIYSYRNRLKARAIDREHFEENIAAIESME